MRMGCCGSIRCQQTGANTGLLNAKKTHHALMRKTCF
jgi:hypothetical protein